MIPVAIDLRLGKSGCKNASVPALRNDMVLRHGPENNGDRRSMRRFSMRLPASVRVPGIPSPFETECQNVSARGIFFHIDRWIKEGSQVEVTMDFPSQVTFADPVRVRFVARVVRTGPQGARPFGVAAAIDGYEFVRPEREDPTPVQSGWRSFS